MVIVCMGVAVVGGGPVCPFCHSFFSFCALHRLRRARPALCCYLPLFVPFPLPGFFPALSILSALGGIQWRGSVLL